MPVNLSFRKLAIVWFACSGILGLLLSLISGIPQLIRLSHRFSLTTGRVTKVDRLQHQSIMVDYSVSGIRYRQTFSPYLWPEAASVEVYYDPNDPVNSVLERPTWLLQMRLKSCAYASLALATTLTFFVAFGERARVFAANIRVRPQLAMTLILLGVAAGIGVQLHSSGLQRTALVAGVVVLSGCLVVLATTISLPPQSGWMELFKARSFWLGVFLVIVGNLLRFLR